MANGEFFQFHTAVKIARTYMTITESDLCNEMVVMFEQLARLIRDITHYHNLYKSAGNGWVPRRPQIKINDIAFTADAEELRKYFRS